MQALNTEDLFVAPRLLTKPFVLVDTVCFAAQVAGSIMSVSEQSSEAQTGWLAIVVGLVLQIVAFVLFATWTAVFHWRIASASAGGIDVGLAEGTAH